MIGLSIIAMGGVIGLFGCDKAMQAEIAPKVGVDSRSRSSVQAGELLTGAVHPQQRTAKQAAWLRFVDRVERGKQVDLSGQYVSKATTVVPAEAGRQLLRPKADAAKANFSKHYKQLADGEWVGIAPASVTANSTGENDCRECIDNPGGGGVGGPLIVSTFTTSVGQGGSGPIRDLKIVFQNPSSSSTILYNAGYTMLNADLNKGVGGAYIYFSFIRNPAQVLLGPEYGSVSSPIGSPDILRAFLTRKGSRFSVPDPVNSFAYIWSPSAAGNSPGVFTTYRWSDVELNYGAGGEWIFSQQSKFPNLVGSANTTEVGVLSGNSSTSQPPAGWTKYPQDLNEGAGGDYIYFCYKN